VQLCGAADAAGLCDGDPGARRGGRALQAGTERLLHGAGPGTHRGPGRHTPDTESTQNGMIIIELSRIDDLLLLL